MKRQALDSIDTIDDSSIQDDHYYNENEEEDEFDQYESNYYTISTPGTSITPHNLRKFQTKISNDKNSKQSLDCLTIPCPQDTINEDDTYKNTVDIIVDKEDDKKKKTASKKRSSFTKLNRLLRPPSYPLLLRSNSTPSKSLSDSKKKNNFNHSHNNKSAATNDQKGSSTKISSSSTSTSPIINQKKNRPFLSSKDYCQHCGVLASSIPNLNQQQQANEHLISRSPSPRLFSRSVSTDGPMQQQQKQSWNRRSVKYYCKNKTKVLYHLVVCRFLVTFNHQDSLCDRFEFEDIDENLVYVRFFKFYRCYDIIPTSAKLVVFDTQLAVKKAFYALLINGIRAAPLWDSQKHQFIGMLTITDFIYILRTFYQSTESKMEKLEEHTLDNWRSILKDKARPLVFVEPDESLFNAIKMLLHNKVHRLPVIDRDSGNVLYIMTHKRILKFLFLFYYTRLPMPSYLQKTLRELPKIGTYENIATATADTPLMDALTTLTERRISALPIVDKKNKVVDVYAKFDVIHLASDKMYQNLDITIKKALEFRNQSEHVVKCTMNETLHTIMERIVQAEVHRIIVVDQEDHVIGIISLSDLLNFLVLRPVNNQVNETGSVDYPSVVDVANSLKSSSLRSDSDLLMTQTATTLVEESGEDVSSQCSHTENDNSRTTMGNLEDDAKIEECEEIALAQEQITENCQLSSLNSSRCSNNRRCSESSSSSTTTTSSSSTSSITNDDNNNDDTTNRPTKSTMAIKASSAATQPTLIA